MDPITTAILAVLPALASETVKSAVKDAYDTVPVSSRGSSAEQPCEEDHRSRRCRAICCRIVIISGA